MHTTALIVRAVFGVIAAAAAVTAIPLTVTGWRGNPRRLYLAVRLIVAAIAATATTGLAAAYTTGVRDLPVEQGSGALVLFTAATVVGSRAIRMEMARDAATDQDQ